MPTADDLFRPTVVPDHPGTGADAGAPAEGKSAEKKAPSGRVRHDEKMTVYVTADELLDIEHARLTLRRNGLSVDRGRLVREAVALVLADLEQNGDDSVIVQRLLQA
jgi:hypothetical protein